MSSFDIYPFVKYFHIEKANVDVGLISFEEGEKYKVAKGFFDYQHAVDLQHGREIEVVAVNNAKCVVLPKSVKNRAKVIYAGTEPIFASLDSKDNLLAYIFLGCVIRVEYLGQRGAEKKVKYFKCF